LHVSDPLAKNTGISNSLENIPLMNQWPECNIIWLVRVALVPRVTYVSTLTPYRFT